MLIYTRRFLVSLIFTTAVETFVLFLLTRKAFKLGEEDISSSKLIFAGWFASFATIPYVWYVFPVIFYSSYSLAIFIGEIFAFFVESFFYTVFLKVGIRKAVIISFLANITSFLLEFSLLKIR